VKFLWYKCVRAYVCVVCAGSVAGVIGQGRRCCGSDAKSLGEWAQGCRELLQDCFDRLLDLQRGQ